MFSLLLSLIIFLISIPVKTVQLGLKVTNKALEKKGGGLRDRLRLSNRNKKNKTDDKETKTKKNLRKVLKVAEKVLAVVSIFLKVLSVIVGLVGFIIGLLIFLCILVLVGGVAGFILMSGDLGIDLGMNFGGGGGIVSDSGFDTGGDFNVKANGDVVVAVQTMAEYYISEIKIYSQSSNYKDCKLLGTGATVRADCSGFAQAVVRYLNDEQGKKANESSVPLTYSDAMIGSGSDWASVLSSSGWVRLDPVNMDVGNLQPGDMLIRKGHVSFYMGVNQIFGWGEPKTKCPYSARVGKYGKYFGIGSKHDYEVVYRYVGNQTN